MHICKLRSNLLRNIGISLDIHVYTYGGKHFAFKRWIPSSLNSGWLCDVLTYMYTYVHVSVHFCVCLRAIMDGCTFLSQY